MKDAVERSPAMPAVVFGLTLLLIALSFAWPVHLVAQDQLRQISPHWSAEAGNVYAVTAWAGWAHFLFAFRGQAQSLSRCKNAKLRLAILTLLLTAAVLVLATARQALGVAWFSAVVWVYFIDHFMKAEQTFVGGVTDMRRWIMSYLPLVTFGWLSVVLLNVGSIIERPWALWIVSTLIATFVLALGWRRLVAGDPRGPLLSLFFVAEALVWGTVSRYGGPTFLAGVYVVHIAAGSYFHYLGSYFFAASKLPDHDRTKFFLAVVLTNILLIAAGCLVTRQIKAEVLVILLSPAWFTLWVALHLVASDVFPVLKRWRPRQEH